MRKSRRIRVLTFGCIHAHHYDPEAVEWLLSRIAHYKPQMLVHLGDQWESIAASRWNDAAEATETLESECRIADTILRSLRKAAPRDCRLVFCPGNHEDNLEAPARIPKLLRSFNSWRTPHTITGGETVNVELSTHWRIGCRYSYSRRQGVFRVGQVTFSHGYEAGSSSDAIQSIQLGVPSGLFISAHTHRPVDVSQVFHTRRVPLPYWYANVGCLRDMKPDYMARKDTTLWGQGCVYVEVDPRGRPGSPRKWEAHLDLFRRYPDLF